MQRLTSALLIAGASGISLSAEGVSRVGKVVELLEGMVKKGEADKHDEQVQFATFQTFCENNIARSSKEIEEAKDSIESLHADISDYIQEVRKLTARIAEHAEDLDVWAKDKKAATSVDVMETLQYEKTHKDYEETITAINSAKAMLKAQPKDRAQAFLLQLAQKKLIPSKVKNAVLSFLQQEPEADAYQFHSETVIELLWDLAKRFSKEKSELETRELRRKGAYERLMQELNMQSDEASADRTQKEALKSTRTQQNVSATEELGDTMKLLKEKSAYNANLDMTCTQKKKAFENRQKLRTEELEVVNEVITIMKEEVAGKAAPSLFQKPAFVQLKASTEVAMQSKVSVFLTQKATKLNSKVLAVLAVRVAADPFKKVKKVIWDLMTRLQNEALEEESQKGFCDAEMGKNKKERELKTEEVEQFTSNIESLHAAIDTAAGNIEEMTRESAELAAANEKQTKMREEESEKNAATIKDSKDAQEAVAQAITILEDFYAKAAKATSFAQEEPEMPEIFDDTPYTGMGGESGGVMGFLEVIQSDFANIQLTTETAEKEAAKEFDEFQIENLSNQKTLKVGLKHQNQAKNEAEANLLEAEDDLDQSKKELWLADKQHEKLKPACVNEAVSYEDRVAQRAEEIESLKEACAILEGRPYGVSDGIFTADF